MCIPTTVHVAMRLERYWTILEVSINFECAGKAYLFVNIEIKAIRIRIQFQNIVNSTDDRLCSETGFLFVISKNNSEFGTFLKLSFN